MHLFKFFLATGKMPVLHIQRLVYQKKCLCYNKNISGGTGILPVCDIGRECE